MSMHEPHTLAVRITQIPALLCCCFGIFPLREITITGLLYLVIEVLGKVALLVYVNDKTEGDEIARDREYRSLETRLVYEAIAEKHSIMSAPAIAFLFLPRKNMAIKTVLTAGLAYIAMEEHVDLLVILVCARLGVHLTQVHPNFTVRDAALYGLLVAWNAFFVIMATMALGIKD